MSLDPLEQDLESLARELSPRLKALTTLSRGLAPLARPGGLAAPGALRKASELLSRADDLPDDLREILGRLASQVDEARTGIARTLRRSFLDRFVPLFTEAGAPPALRSEDPLEYRVAPLTVLLDFGSEAAGLQYARLPVGKPLPLDPEAILAAWRSARAELDSSSCAPDRFAAALASGYRALLARRGSAAAERVELAELYPEVAFALQPQKLLEDFDRKNLKGYGRTQFIHDLLRFRREAGLTIGEHRADLGVAHAGGASSKRRAFWLEDDHGQGMFYTSFRLTPAAHATPSQPPPVAAPEGSRDQE